MFGSKKKRQLDIRIARMEARILRLEDRVSNLEIKNIPVTKTRKKKV